MFKLINKVFGVRPEPTSPLTAPSLRDIAMTLVASFIEDKTAVGGNREALLLVRQGKSRPSYSKYCNYPPAKVSWDEQGVYIDATVVQAFWEMHKGSAKSALHRLLELFKQLEEWDAPQPYRGKLLYVAAVLAIQTGRTEVVEGLITQLRRYERPGTGPLHTHRLRALERSLLSEIAPDKEITEVTRAQRILEDTLTVDAILEGENLKLGRRDNSGTSPEAIMIG